MEIVNVEEHEDGGATYTFDISQEEKDLLVPSGIQLAILLGMTNLSFNDLVKLVFNEVDSNEN